MSRPCVFVRSFECEGVAGMAWHGMAHALDSEVKMLSSEVYILKHKQQQSCRHGCSVENTEQPCCVSAMTQQHWACCTSAVTALRNLLVQPACARSGIV